ncbi:MAG TPA: response regulator [Actinomycetes bacterium]
MGDVVLIADDEEDIIRFVEINLRLEGLDVITARDGEEALHQALTQRPSLLLLDAMMPLMDGYEVCAKLRADERTFQMPIIMLTAKSLEADRALARDVGADDIIIKPFDPTELVEKVKALIAGGLRSAPAAAEPWSPGSPTTWPEPGSGSGEPWLRGDGGDSAPEGGAWPGGTSGGDAPWRGSETPPGGGGDPWPGGGSPGTGGAQPGTGEADDPRWPDEDDRDPWSPGSGGRWPPG